jgi:hypothetical protein
VRFSRSSAVISIVHRIGSAQIARLIEAAYNVGRAERNYRKLLADDLKQSLVLDVFDSLHRPADPLKIRTQIGATIFEAAVEDGAANVLCSLAVPNIVNGFFRNIANRFDLVIQLWQPRI